MYICLDVLVLKKWAMIWVCVHIQITEFKHRLNTVILYYFSTKDTRESFPKRKLEKHDLFFLILCSLHANDAVQNVL